MVVFWDTGRFLGHGIYTASSSDKLARKSRSNPVLLSLIVKDIQRSCISSVILRQKLHCFSETAGATKSEFMEQISYKLATK